MDEDNWHANGERSRQVNLAAELERAKSALEFSQSDLALTG